MLCGNCTHNYSRGTEDTEDLREVCPKGAQKRSERKTLSWQQEDGRADQFRSCSSWCSGDRRLKLDLLLWPRDQETEFSVEAWWLSQTQEGQTEQIYPQTFNDPFFLDSPGIIYTHWVPILRQLRRWKRLWRRSLTRSHKRTSMWPSRSCRNSTSALKPEEIASKGIRVSCVYYQ